MSRYRPEFIAAMEDWVTHVLTWMGLTQWQVVLLEAPPDDPNAAASIDCIYGRNWADLCLSVDFFKFDADKQKHYLLHEMCHIMLNPMDKVVDFSDMKEITGVPVWKVFSAAYTLQLENVVDHLASMIEDFFDDAHVQFHAKWAAVLAAESDAPTENEQHQGDDGEDDQNGPKHEVTLPADSPVEP